MFKPINEIRKTNKYHICSVEIGNLSIIHKHFGRKLISVAQTEEEYTGEYIVRTSDIDEGIIDYRVKVCVDVRILETKIIHKYSESAA